MNSDPETQTGSVQYDRWKSCAYIYARSLIFLALVPSSI